MSIVKKIINAFRRDQTPVVAFDEELKNEYRNRLDAVDVLKEGASALETLASLAAMIASKEAELASQKNASLEDPDRDNWWNMSSTGWSGGEMHRFGEALSAIFMSLNEPSLAKQIRKQLCFERNLPVAAETKEPAPEYPKNQEECIRHALASIPKSRDSAMGDWADGRFGFRVNTLSAPVISAALNDAGIDHTFTSFEKGQPLLCFRSERDMNSALRVIR